MVKKIFILAIIVVGSLIIVSCESDFEINGPYQDISIVYGLLNQAEPEHYIKINRAFLGDNALILANDPNNSSYGDSLQVWIEDWRFGNYLTTYNLIDTLIKKNVSSSPFYNPNNPYQIVYKFKANLNQDSEYRLFIKNKYTGKIVSSQTRLVKEFSIIKPRSGQPTFSFTGTSPTPIEWTSGELGRLYQLVIRFNYIEKNIKTLVVDSTKFVDWVFPVKRSKTLLGGEKFELEFLGEGFYKNIKGTVKTDENVQRWYRNVQFIFSVAADDFATYMDVNKPSSSIVQERPEYSNINNGIGIFSSRYIKSRDLMLSSPSEDSLVKGIHTSGLSFIKKPL